jgi:hypothetical protein
VAAVADRGVFPEGSRSGILPLYLKGRGWYGFSAKGAVGVLGRCPRLVLDGAFSALTVRTSEKLDKCAEFLGYESSRSGGFPAAEITGGRQFGNSRSLSPEAWGHC